MKNFKLFTALSCVVMMAGVVPFAWSATSAPGQTRATANSTASAVSSTAAAASTRGRSAAIKNGTKINAELVSNIDSSNAKEGDKVVARVTKNVKQHGKVIVHKGDRLVGHVTSVRKSVKGKGGSSLGVQFDQLVQGNSTTHLNAVLTSVLAARGQAQGSGSMAMPAMSAPVAPQAGGGGGGGLLGGAGAAVGSTVGSTVGAAGSTLGQAGGAVGATTQDTLGANSNLGLATPVRQIHIGSSASAESSAGTNSTLSTRKGNLRLASGTRMKFRVAADSSVRASR